MPILDKERGVLVVRVVYDGPPMSGKTTTVRALAEGLGVPITSPEEKDGRTVFFDWVDYVGGLFEGRQIRCQILSVPGQVQLANRRRLLIESADAIVMVADTREGHIDQTYDLVKSLLPWARAQEPPIGIVIQANKRDAPDSVPRATIHEEFARLAPVAVVDTVATTGEGVREAFVFAVRLALDRVRALAGSHGLRVGAPEVDSPEQQLERMAPVSVVPGAFPSTRPPAANPALVAAYSESHELERLSPFHVVAPAPPLPREVIANDERVFVPDPMMPGGFIWPPVDGRTLLHEVAQLDRTPVRTRRGDWWASGEGWRFHSAATSLYESADLGRQELIEWARLHAANLQRLSPGRTVILVDAGGGRFRLWQLVRVSEALRERLVTYAADAEAEQLARELLSAGFHLVRARRVFQGSDISLPCTLWTVSSDVQRQPTYVGLMPTPRSEGVQEVTDADLLEREFRPLFQNLEAERNDYDAVVAALSRVHTNGSSGVAEKLLRLASGKLARGSAQNP